MAYFDISFHSLISQFPVTREQGEVINTVQFHRNAPPPKRSITKHRLATHTKMKWETLLASLLCLEIVICRNASHVSFTGAHTGDCRFFLFSSVCESGNASATNSIHVAMLLPLSCRIASFASILKFRATATARTTGRLRCWSATTEKRPAKKSVGVRLFRLCSDS